MDVLCILVFSAFLIQGCYATVAASCDTPCPVKVLLDSGPVCGRVLLAENSTQYHSFWGIPYAKPPIGHRRFQAPEPPEPWHEPLYATVEGPACPQREILYGTLPVQNRGQSEDCLYVNVQSPSVEFASRCRKGRGRPVLVFIHGGGFYSGSGNRDLHGPEYLIRKGVVVVTFNYRIGILGFLALNTTKVVANAGLRDQVELLRWVQRNIRAFNGDPDNVTLMGHSAGATSAHLLSLSKATLGLFKRLILLSGTGLTSYYSASPSYTEFVNKLFFQNAGINSTDPEEIYAQLVAMPLHKIMYASVKVQYVTGFISFPPTIEEYFPGVSRIIDDEPLNLVAQQRGKHYTILICYTSDEMEFARYFLLMLNTLERLKSNHKEVLSPRLSFSLPPDETARLAERVKQRYFNGTATLDALIKIYSDTFFKYPSFKLAEWRAQMDGAPVYLHQFSYESLFSVLKHGLWIDYDGAAHGDDLTYVFRPSAVLGDYVSFPPKTRDDEMKEWMTTIITNFMRCSNPTCMDDDVSPWPPVARYHTWYQNTVKTSYDVMEPTPEQREMIEFHDSIDPQSRAVSQQLAGFVYRKK